MDAEQKAAWQENMKECITYPNSLYDFPASCSQEAGWLRAGDLAMHLDKLKSCPWVPKDLFDFHDIEIDVDDCEHSLRLTLTYQNVPYTVSFDESGLEYLHVFLEYILQQTQSAWSLMLYMTESWIVFSPMPCASIARLAEMGTLTKVDLENFELS